MERHLNRLLHKGTKHANIGSVGENIQIIAPPVGSSYSGKTCGGGGGAEGVGLTFAGGGATVVFEVGAVFALVVFGAVAVVVGGQVEAGRSVLTRVG